MMVDQQQQQQQQQGEEEENLNENRELFAKREQQQQKIENKKRNLYKIAEKNLVDAVEKSLERAQRQNVSVIKQQEILSELFHDISQPIDTKFRKLLDFNPSENEMDDEDEEMNRKSCIYFYELISRYYYKHPEQASNIHSLTFRNLITNHHFPSIYALLFHRWLFSGSSPETSHLTLSRCNIFLKGTNRLFWNDVENYTFKYKPLFSYLKVTVLLKKDLDSIFQFMELPSMKNNSRPFSANEISSFSVSNTLSATEEEKLAHTTDEELMKQETEEKRLQTELMEREEKQQQNSDSSNEYAPVAPYVTIDKNKQQFVIESKKKDLISLVAKYFFYYEDKNSRLQLPNYIQQLTDKHAASIINALHAHHMDDEYDELSELGEIGGWASLFSSNSNQNNKMIDYRRFSITDPMFNEQLAQQFDERAQIRQMISDIFVTENIFLLSVLNNEKILVSIINNFRIFKQLDISSKCKVKLQAALYAAARPGPPNYPPRKVRHKAQAILDELFPRGRYIRFLMNSSFRVLHHYTWPLSILYWCRDKFLNLLYTPCALIRLFKHHFVFDPKLSKSILTPPATSASNLSSGK